MKEALQFLVLELGGTTIRAGLYRAHTGTIDRFRASPIPNHHNMPTATGEEIVASIIREIILAGNAVLEDRPAHVVSIAFPGPLDPTGHILAAPTVWSDRVQRPVDILAPLRQAWPGARISMLNDVTAAGYHFLRHRHDDVGVFNVGSGIGNKIFIQGAPTLGPGGRGGEIGHVRVDFDDDAPICECGHRGHLGAVASGRAAGQLVCRLATADPAGFAASVLGRLANRRAAAATSQMVVEAASRADPWALTVVAALARPLGWVLASTHLAAGIERFVIVGGFARALGEPYRAELAKAASANTWPNGVDWNAMIDLDYDDQAALKGAGKFAMMNEAEVT